MKPTPPPPPLKTSADSHRRLMRATPWLLALAGLVLVVRNTGHPGLTWDEANYIVAGRSYAEAQTFRGDTPWRNAWALNHEHPPLAKVAYGLSGLALEEFLGIAAYRLPAALIVAGALTALPVWLWRGHGLAYYNAMTGWPRGAERVGLEIDYWGTGFETDVIDQLAQQARHLERLVYVRFAGIGELVQRLTIAPGEELVSVLIADDSDDWEFQVVSNSKARIRVEGLALALADPPWRIWTKRLFDGTPLIEIYAHPGREPLD